LLLGGAGGGSSTAKIMIVALNKQRSRLATKREDRKIRRIKTGSAIVVI
jgi:hypothetical protein